MNRHLLRNERIFSHAVSVASFPFNHLIPNNLSARYLLLRGKVADRTPRCVVTLTVCCAQSGQMPKRSATNSAETLACCLLLTKVRRAGTSVCS